VRHEGPYVPRSPAVHEEVHLSESHIEQLRVPVRRAQVEVYTERERRTAVLFLAPDCAPEEVFEAPAPFFPAEEGGMVRIFARSSVVSLVVDACEATPGSLAGAGVVYVPRSIAVTLRNGQVVTGALTSLSLLSRTLDLVNQAPKSFAVRVGDRVHHIAKAHVDRIEEL
jgi:hypothetical protein